MENLPRYFIIGLRPVKVVRNEEGGVGCLAYDWDTGEFKLAWDYLDRIFFGKGDDIEEVSAIEFEKSVEELNSRLGK